MNIGSFWQAVAVVSIPLMALLFPGIAAVRLMDFRDLLANGARVFLWSTVALILGSFLAAAAHIPMYWVLTVLGIVSLVTIARRRKNIFCLSCGWAIMAVVTPIVLAYAAFAVPYFLRFDGLPTGDSQKAIFWAQNVMSAHALPNYSIAVDQLNRDPGDFFTPGLHTFTALIMSASPQPFITIGLTSIVLAIAVAWLAAAISNELFDDTRHLIPPLLAAFFVLTNFRFLRYLREPGYHYQNLMGEFLLFGLLLVGLRLLRRFAWSDAILAALLIIALVVSHQFTVFIGFFALLPLAITFIGTYRSQTIKTSIVVVLGALALLGIPFGLYAKIPHLFTNDAHLYSLLPTIVEYPLLLGPLWITFGIAGLILLTYSARKSRHAARWAFALGTLVILALSQGPRLLIDIPPVRALLYSVVPLSICAAYFVMTLRHFITRTYTGAVRNLLLGALAACVIIPASASVRDAFAGSSTNAPTNATLTVDQLAVGPAITNQLGSVLIDDHNRRSDSWVILHGRPMYTRLTSDIRRHMAEANQSSLRSDLYLRQLVFEKIYMLASHPAAVFAIQEQGLGFVAGVSSSSATAFEHNPALIERARSGPTVYFAPLATEYTPSELDAWFLRTSTLVNDIGDREDTQPHLQAAVRTPRLSDPQFDDVHTFRTTTSPIITLEFNVSDYVETLWNQEHTAYPDTDVQLYVATTFGPNNIRVATATGARYELVPGQPLTLSASDIPLNNGVVKLNLENPTQQLVGIDMIALGLARIP